MQSYYSKCLKMGIIILFTLNTNTTSGMLRLLIQSLGNPTHKFIYTLIIAYQIVVVNKVDKSLQINCKFVNVPFTLSLFD